MLRFYGPVNPIQATVIYTCTVLVTVTLVWRVKRVICKTWTETLVNNTNPDLKLLNVASDQGLHCLLKLQEVKG